MVVWNPWEALPLKRSDEMGAGSGPKPAEAVEEAKQGESAAAVSVSEPGRGRALADHGARERAQGRPVTTAVFVVWLLFHRMQTNET